MVEACCLLRGCMVSSYTVFYFVKSQGMSYYRTKYRIIPFDSVRYRSMNVDLGITIVLYAYRGMAIVIEGVNATRLNMSRGQTQHDVAFF